MSILGLCELFITLLSSTSHSTRVVPTGWHEKLGRSSSDNCIESRMIGLVLVMKTFLMHEKVPDINLSSGIQLVASVQSLYQAYPFQQSVYRMLAEINHDFLGCIQNPKNTLNYEPGKEREQCFPLMFIHSGKCYIHSALWILAAPGPILTHRTHMRKFKKCKRSNFLPPPERARENTQPTQLISRFKPKSMPHCL